MGTRKLAAQVMVGVLALAGCASEVEDRLEPEPEIDQKQDPLYVLSTSLWPQDRDIPVCWELTANAFPNERGWVRDQVARTWETVSNVRFVGWGTCATGAKGIRIGIHDQTAAPHAAIGTTIDGKVDGMVLNFTFNNWGISCQPATQRESCIRSLAVHEFGHALGFAHEQNRPDTNRETCKDEPQGTNGDLLYGSWDLLSTMNYCNPLWNNGGQLSPKDVSGVRALYGTRQVNNFGYESGTWRTGKHLRMVADVNDDDRDDIIGFGDSGVIVSFARSSGGGFEAPRQLINAFGYNQGWRSERHVRTMADVNADGRADIVAFGDDGVSLSLSGGTRFYAPTLLGDFGYNQGWRVEQHERMLADVNDDGRPDIVGFGRDGVWVALSQNASFGAPQLVLQDFGYNQGWRPTQHVRTLADVNDDGRLDIVGFGTYGVFVSLNTVQGFSAPSHFSGEFGFNGGYRVGLHPRFMADVNLDGRADVVAFAAEGVRVALSGGNTFYPSQLVVAEMGYDQGWYDAKNPRFVRDINGDDRPDLIGFGDEGIIVSYGRGGSVFSPVQLAAIRYSAADAKLRNGTPLALAEQVRGLGDFDGDGAADVFAFRADGFHTTDLTIRMQQ